MEGTECGFQGTLIYIGYNTALTTNYRFIIVNFGSENLISLFCGLIIFGIGLILIKIIYPQSIVAWAIFLFLVDSIIFVYIGNEIIIPISQVQEIVSL